MTVPQKFIAFMPQGVPPEIAAEACNALTLLNRRHTDLDVAELIDGCCTARIPKDGMLDHADSPVVGIDKLSDIHDVIILIIPDKAHYDGVALLHFIESAQQANEHCEIWWTEIGGLTEEQRNWDVFHALKGARAFSPSNASASGYELEDATGIFVQVLLEHTNYWRRKFDKTIELAQTIPD